MCQTDHLSTEVIALAENFHDKAFIMQYCRVLQSVKASEVKPNQLPFLFIRILGNVGVNYKTIKHWIKKKK